MSWEDIALELEKQIADKADQEDLEKLATRLEILESWQASSKGLIEWKHWILPVIFTAIMCAVGIIALLRGG